LEKVTGKKNRSDGPATILGIKGGRGEIAVMRNWRNMYGKRYY
jgi:hypothetical protein